MKISTLTKTSIYIVLLCILGGCAIKSQPRPCDYSSFAQHDCGKKTPVNRTF